MPYAKRLATRLGLIVLVVLACGLALMSSALRWGVVPGRDSVVGELAPTSEEDDPADEGKADGEPEKEPGGARDDPSVPYAQELDSSQLTTFETALPLEGAAQELLERYERQDRCLMRYAGYLDLLGEVWSCVVVGPGWVDVCVVRECGENGGSQVRISRLEVEAWEGYGNE
ncbi:MAG: hypothetical protein Q4B54_01180 [Coriobacteriales bacterium]|nr:hypothetical protein [Coriobacteriales bacterium]